MWACGARFLPMGTITIHLVIMFVYLTYIHTRLTRNINRLGDVYMCSLRRVQRLHQASCVSAIYYIMIILVVSYIIL